MLTFSEGLDKVGFGGDHHRLCELVESVPHALETALRRSNVSRRVAEVDDFGVVRQRLLVGHDGAFEIAQLLRHALELPRVARKGLGTFAIAISELRGFAIAGLVSEALGLAEGVGAPIDICQPSDESARQTKKRIG